MRQGRTRTRRLAVFLAFAMAAATAGVISSSAGAANLVTNEVEVDFACAADAGSLGGVQQVTQTSSYRATAPDEVPEGATFDIVIEPFLTEFPTSQSSNGISATIRKVLDLNTRYKLPDGVVVNSVTQEPAPGADTLGWYVAPGASRTDPSVRQEIPGGTTAVYDEEAREARWVYTGTGSARSTGGVFRGGSAIQPPNVRINVTATAPAGTQLDMTLAGSIPGNPGSVPWPGPALRTTTRVTALGFINI